MTAPKTLPALADKYWQPSKYTKLSMDACLEVMRVYDGWRFEVSIFGKGMSFAEKDYLTPLAAMYAAEKAITKLRLEAHRREKLRGQQEDD